MLAPTTRRQAYVRLVRVPEATVRARAGTTSGT
jgi:hypothetical protein